MKRINYILCAAVTATFALVSCSKAELPSADELGGQTEIADGQLRLNITVAALGSGSGTDHGTETKAVKKDWATGDKINVWYDTNTDYSTEGKPDLVIKYDGSAWVADADATLSGNEPSNSGTMKVIYEASNNWTENYVHDEASSRAVYETSSRGYFTKLTAYAYGCAYSVENDLLSATISDWTYMTPIQIVVTGLDPEKASDYVLSADLGYTSGITMTEDAITTLKGTVNPWEYLPRQLGAPNEDGVAFYFQPVSATETKDSYNISLYDRVNKVNKSYTLEGTITADVKKCQSFRIKESSFALNGAVIDGLTYNFSKGKAILVPGTYYAGGGLYKGDINVPASVTIDGTEYPVTAIGNSAFANCRNLTSVTLPEGLVEIGPSAFSATSLKTLVLPASLRTIDSANWVFNSSDQLTISVAEGNPYFFIEDKFLYGKESETSYILYHVPEYITGDIVLSKYTTKITSNGTLYNTQADSVELPACLKGLWGQFRGKINTGLVVKFNYSTYAEFTEVIGETLDSRAKYKLGEYNMSKIVYSFPSTMSDDDFAQIKTFFGTSAKEVVRR